MQPPRQARSNRTHRRQTDARPSSPCCPSRTAATRADDAFFVDGIHDDILTQLSKVSALKVISRTSVERFRRHELSVQQIAQQLGVRNILEGGVQRAGDRVRINVQLIDATTDAHLWAESYDRELTAANIFAIQSEVAAAIADALKTTLTPAEQARANAVPTQNLKAWEAYQLGKQRMAKRTSADLADAEQFFREAIDLDPQFALAYVGLADTLYCRSLQRRTQGIHPRQRREGGGRGPRVGPEPGRSVGFLGPELRSDRRQFERAESMFRRAIELNPNYAPAHHWYSMMLGIVGRLDEALAQAERAVELDPLSAVIKANLGSALEQTRPLSEAEAAYRRAIDDRSVEARSVRVSRDSECVCPRPLHGRRTVGPESHGT